MPFTVHISEEYVDIQQSGNSPSTFSSECSYRQEEENTTAAGNHSQQQCARRVFFSQHILPCMSLRSALHFEGLYWYHIQPIQNLEPWD